MRPALLVIVLLVVVQTSAGSADPGETSGKIAYDTRLGFYVMNADGTGKRLVISGRTFDAVWSPDGQRIAYTVYRLKQSYSDLYVVKADGTVRWRVVRDTNSFVSWSPDGNTLAFSRQAAPGLNAPSDIWTVGVDGRDQRRLTRTPLSETDPKWARTERRSPSR